MSNDVSIEESSKSRRHKRGKRKQSLDQPRQARNVNRFLHDIPETNEGRNLINYI